MSNVPVAVQLYTVRGDAESDFAGTIEKVAKIGYKGVELAGHGGLSPANLRILLEDHNLKIAGSHVGLAALEADLQKVIDENLEIGNPSVVVPFLDPKLRTAEGYRSVADALNRYGAALQASGLTLGYHNHAFEFEPLEDGKVGLEILLENTDPKLVSFELDTYWVLVGGQDPVEFVIKYQNRINLLHIKDRDPQDGSFAEVGTGDLPLDGLVAQAKSGGRVKWLIVEQDVCKRPPLESIEISYNNLKSKGYV